MGSVATRDEALVRALDNAVWDMGWSVSPDDAYQMLRGLRTLETRMARHDASGRQIAMWLNQQPGVAQVLHPALPSSVDYALWARDFTGAAGLFAVVLDTHAPEAAHAFLNALTVFRLGFSWGGFESLALDCDPQFHVRQAPREYQGPIIRLNIGLEAPEDLIADLERGLQASLRV
jgi:cystathionine beta-lyase